MKEVRNIFIESCNKIADLIQDKHFKAIQKGQILKKKSKNKDIVYEIVFQSSFRNTNFHISILPHINVYSKKLKEWIIEQTNNSYSSGIVVSEYLGNITPYKTSKSWNLAGLSREKYIEEIAELLNKYALPIFDLFEETTSAIDFLAENGQQFNKYVDDSLLPLGFMIRFAPKEKAEKFFNHFISHCKFKGRIIELYKSLEHSENIDLNYSEFSYASDIKLAYINKLKIIK
ncbi:hypothetical protein [uncultured Apibacter sp.]|uniref:DUF4304 domain-containing protein n=1 Tax=uncultured Apibacter sp. TaxID=1778616 RepID=UPI0025FAEDD2|nr:hypothetical protein [uncultured Apibacter sp.]